MRDLSRDRDLGRVGVGDESGGDRDREERGGLEIRGRVEMMNEDGGMRNMTGRVCVRVKSFPF